MGEADGHLSMGMGEDEAKRVKMASIIRITGVLDRKKGKRVTGDRPMRVVAARVSAKREKRKGADDVHDEGLMT